MTRVVFGLTCLCWLTSATTNPSAFFDVELVIGNPQEIWVPPAGSPTRLLLRKTWANGTHGRGGVTQGGEKGDDDDDDTPAFFVFEVHTHAVGVRFEPRWPFRKIANATDGRWKPTGEGSHYGNRLRRDHGIVLKNDPNQTLFCTYIGNVKNYHVKALVLVRGYSDWAPVPSLGKDKFSTNSTVRSDIALEWDEFVTTMTFKASGSLQQPPAGQPTNLAAERPYGENTMFHYQVYRYWFKEGDFSQDSYIYGLSNMLFKKDIEVNGVLVQSHFVKRDPQAQQVTVKFPSFPGTNQLFAVVVTTTTETPSGEKTFHSVYSSAVTADCNMKVLGPTEAALTNDDDSDDHARWHCVRVYFTETQVMMAVLVFLGLFVIFLGHRWFQLTQFIFGTFLASVVAYPFAAGLLSFNHYNAWLFSVSVGVCGGAFVFFVWWSLRSPPVSVSLPVVMTGLVLAMVIVHVGNSLQTEAMMSDVIYYSVVAATVLVYFVTSIRFTKLAHLASCAVIGGFTLALTLDHYMGASIKFIILNFLRRTFVSGYSEVCCQLPFQDHERLIVIVWAAAVVLSLAFQSWRESGRPPFPTNSSQPSRYLQLEDDTQRPFVDGRPINGDDGDVDESSPLIAREEVDYVQPSAPPTSQVLESGGHVVGYIQGYGAVTSQDVSPIFRAASRDPRFTSGSGGMGDPREHQLMQRAGVSQVTLSSTGANSLNSCSDGSFRPRTISPGGTIVTVVNRPPRYLPKKKKGAQEDARSVPKDIFKPPDLDSQLSQS